MARPALSFWITRRDLVGSFLGQRWLAAWWILRVRQVPARLVKSRLALLRLHGRHAPWRQIPFGRLQRAGKNTAMSITLAGRIE